MLGFFLILLIVGTNAQRVPFPYVEARNSFTHTRLFLQERLPQKKLDITNPEDRKHFNYGVLAGVTLALVKAFNDVSTVYNPSKVLYETVPDAWEGYNETSRIVNSLLAEVKTKIKPITSLINSLCRTTDSAEACNTKVHNHVIKLPFLSRRAKFLLQVAKAARILNKQETLLDDVASSDTAVPYLFKLVESTPYEIFIAELTRAYEFMRPRNSIRQN